MSAIESTHFFTSPLKGVIMKAFNIYSSYVSIRRRDRVQQSLFSFLDEHKMLKTRVKDYVSYGVEWCDFSLKLVKLLPFFILAFRCKEINSIFSSEVKSLKMFKNRAKNYYCMSLVKKLVSIFGNERAWDEFEISSQWKPKFKFVKLDYYFVPCTSLIKCCCYKQNVVFLYDIQTSTTIESLNQDYNPIDSDDLSCCLYDFYSTLPESRSRRKINIVLNNSLRLKKRDAVSRLLNSFANIRRLFGEDIITDDGLELYKSLNMLSIIR